MLTSTFTLFLLAILMIRAERNENTRLTKELKELKEKHIDYQKLNMLISEQRTQINELSKLREQVELDILRKVSYKT